MQDDITREAIQTIIKASETAIAQAVNFAHKTEEINKRLVKSVTVNTIVICSTFALILIFLFGFYFIGYTDY